jgi:hypothetical protein
MLPTSPNEVFVADTSQVAALLCRKRSWVEARNNIGILGLPRPAQLSGAHMIPTPGQVLATLGSVAIVATEMEQTHG